MFDVEALGKRAFRVFAWQRHPSGNDASAGTTHYYSPEDPAPPVDTHMTRLREKLVAFLRERKSITTQEFKDLVGATRKHVIPLAEHFDEEKVTLRVGEKRVLRGEGKP